MTGVLVWLSVGVYFGLVFGLACAAGNIPAEDR